MTDRLLAWHQRQWWRGLPAFAGIVLLVLDVAGMVEL